MHKFLILLEIIVDGKPHFFLLIKIKQAKRVNINIIIKKFCILVKKKREIPVSENVK